MILERPHFHFVTLFPSTIQAWMESSVIGRALAAKHFSYSIYQLRDFGQGNYRSVDDSPYGGGAGMVLRIEPLVKAIETIRANIGPAKGTVVSFSPGGRVLCSEIIEREVSRMRSAHYIFVCGHYEGIDQRFIDHWVDLEVSLGNYVVTGGELPALVMADAMIRKIPGALENNESLKEESFHILDPSTHTPLVEYPHYTRPAEFRGLRVPEVLVSGDHSRVATWRLEQARKRTQELGNQGS